MTAPVIQVYGLGKLFRIGALTGCTTLRESLGNAIKAPFRRSSARKSGEILWALRDVSFSVQPGEVVGLVGRNGAGKSTLLKILSRITRPTEGYAEIRGRVGSLLEVGTGFHPDLTGRENAYLSGAILGMRKTEIDRKFDAIVAFAEVERFIDTQLKHYSSGMQMRLAFAVAAHLEPEILLVDEVLAVGDAAFQKKCLGKMSDVARHGRTILFVSHNLTALRKLCPRAVWLNDGNCVEDGPSDEVVAHYLPKNNANLESIWEDEATAPGDHRVRLQSARVVPQTTTDGIITVHTPLQIEFTYWNYVPDKVLNLSMVLYGSDDVIAFATVSDSAPRPVGSMRHTVEIPGDFLNAGVYSVTLFVVEDATRAIVQQDHIVGFEVVEGRVTGNWYGKMPGVVRPVLRWRAELVHKSDLEAQLPSAS